MIELLISWSVRNRGTVFFLVLALAISGGWAFSTLRVDAFPDLSNVQVEVFTEAPGMSPVEVERLVTYPLEVSLTGIPGVADVHSLSRYGLSVLRVVFVDGTDIYFARTRVSEALQAARSDLPTSATTTMGPLSGSISEIYQYTLAGPGHDLMELRTLQDRVVAPQLRTVVGVAEVNSWGGLVRELQVTVQPEQLAAHALTLEDVVAALEENSLQAASGYLQRAGEQYILRGLGQAEGDIANTVIRADELGRTVTVGDVAEVAFGPEVRQGAVTQDAQGEVVTGIVMALRGTNTRILVERVRDRVEEINRALPDGVTLEPYYDQTELVAETLTTVRHNLMLGGFLVIAILLAFLGNLRAALLVASTIPLSLLFAFLGMRWLGLSANLMSLGAIDFGMIVDGSVVMSEHLIKELHKDEEAGSYPTDRQSLFARIIELGREVGRPVLFGVLIILLVYVPIATLQGLEGRMFRPMAITVSTALFGSLLLAVAFLPAAATVVFKKGARESALAIRMSAWFDRWYSPLLRRSVRHPRRTVGIAIIALLAALLLVPQLGTEFLPELDEGSFQITALRDPSISLEKSMAMQQRLEYAVLMTPEVTTVLSQIGRAEIASDPAGVDRAEVFVMLQPRDRWRAGMRKDDLREEMESNIAAHAPGLSVSFSQPVANRLDELTSGVRADLAIKVFGSDAEVDRQVAERIARVVAGVPGAAEVQVGATTGQTYLNVQMDREAMARHGIGLRSAQAGLAAAVSGEAVAEIAEGSWTTDVTIMYPPDQRSSREALGLLTVPGVGGTRVPFNSFADFMLESGPVLIQREAGQRLVIVQANVEGRDLGGFAADVQAAVRRQVDVPSGVFVRYGGSFENQRRAMARLRLVVPLSILMIALLLYASLQSWPLALIVLLNLPFAAVGGVAALWVRGLHLSVSASIGFIALFGVAVLNGLVLLTTVQRAHRNGPLDAVGAAIAGARERLRPVLMTATVASVGFLPVALSHGTGAEVQRPLATVVIGGLITSTLLTLLVLPTLYAWLERPGAQSD